MTPNPDLDLLAEQITTALMRRLAPTLAEQLRHHQERMSRTWLTPPIAARLVGCNDSVLYAALRTGKLPGNFNADSNGGRGSWYIRRSDLDAWADRLRDGVSTA
jgi:hypothetical protein